MLYCGDNLEVLEEYLPAASVDLIYLDPPFNSERIWNLVYRDSRAQAKAFKDYWSWPESAETYERIVKSGATPKPLRTFLHGLHELLIERDSDMLAYLSMMTARLIALHRVLKPTGSIYLHCDPTASHYLKVILDVIFGSDRFLNEIVWQRSGAKNDSIRYGRSHDVLLFYSRGERFTWDQQYTEMQDYSIVKNYTAIEAETGRRYRLGDLTAAKPGGDTSYEWHGKRPYKGRYWAYSKEKMDQMLAEGRIVFRRTGMPVFKRYLDEQPGVPVQDVWTDIKQLASASPERLGYPTQKPVALLERIIKSSTKPNDLVLDPFCGCGTTIEACEKLGRRWIGIDFSHRAVEVIETRFARLGWPAPPTTWHPVDVEAAQKLAARRNGKGQFEAWVRLKLRARKRDRDRGIDGEAYFRDASGTLHHVIISVKGGKLKPTDLRDLRGTIEREGAAIGVLVSIEAPKKEMQLEAARAKFLDASDERGPIPRLQLVQVNDEFFKRYPVRVPGVNVTDMPQPEGEQLRLALNPGKPIRTATPQARAGASVRAVSNAPSHRSSKPPKP